MATRPLASAILAACSRAPAATGSDIVLRNNGGTPVNLSQAMLSGADAGEFTITNSGYVSPIVNQTGSYSWFSIKVLARNARRQAMHCQLHARCAQHRHTLHI